MAKPEFERARYGEDATERNFDAIGTAVNTLRSIPITDGRIITEVTITGGSVDNAIEHKLSRQIQGWIVTNKDTEGDYPARSSTDTDDTKWLILTCGTTQIVNLWVF